MQTSGQTDPAVAKYYSLKPTSFHNLVRFELRADDLTETGRMVLEIDLASKKAVNPSLLRLTFSGVSELKYNPSYWSFAFIDIVPIQYQWENKNYRVCETEQDTDFSLTCRSFEAEIIPA